MNDKFSTQQHLTSISMYTCVFKILTLSLRPLLGCLATAAAGSGVVGVTGCVGGGALVDGPGVGGASGRGTGLEGDENKYSINF